MAIEPDLTFVDGPEGRRLAVRHRPAPAGGQTFVWFGGFKSDMIGTKAVALDRWCAGAGHGCLRFDYSGHGESEGDFRDGSPEAWSLDARAVVSGAVRGDAVFVGSSMGAWMALLTLKALPGRARSLVLIAPAPDFTDKLMWPGLPDEAKAAIETTGSWMRPSAYGDGDYPLTKALFEAGKRVCVLDGGPIPFAGKVRILQGTADPDVPWRHAVRTLEAIDSPDARLTLIRGGDHRLSTPAMIDLLLKTCAEAAA